MKKLPVRKITIELELDEELTADYADVCSELTVEDMLSYGVACDYKVVKDNWDWKKKRVKK